jgi:heat-inducible transcriptional repressor
MSLDKRKVKILKAVISSYVDNAEAVGSRTISKKYELGVSPATIRNEMSDLEEMGFLMQPHASAGRIPTDKAYRYYVDDIWKKVQNSNATNIDQLRSIIEEKANEIDSIFKNSVRILSQFTKYSSFIVAPQLKQAEVKRIQLVPITDRKILLVLILKNNIVKEVMLKLKSPVPLDQVDQISSMLSEKLYGYKLEDIRLIMDNLIVQFYHIKESSNSLLMELLPFLVDQVGKLENFNVYADGLTNILNLPEYNDVVKAREFISFIEDKDSLAKLFQFTGENDLDVSIGRENAYEELRDCSLITATYKLNGKLIGKIGVIGPTRMNYNKVISTVRSMAEAMNEIISQSFDEDNKE